jgi:hypothetical protein
MLGAMGSKRSGNKRFDNIKSLATFIFIIFLTTGCVTFTDPETSQEININTVAVVSPDQSVGQTFLSRHPKLNGIDLWLQVENPGNLVKIELIQNVDDQNPVFQGLFRTSNGKIHVNIPPQDAPPNQPYFIRLSSETDEVKLLGRNEDNYPKGDAFVNDTPIDADIAFRATYEYDIYSILDDLSWMLSKLHLIIPLTILLILPGWLLIEISNQKDQFDWGERVAISLGISLAILPLLMLWTSFLGLHWEPISVWLTVVGLICISVWKWFQHKSKKIEKEQFINENQINDCPSRAHENRSEETDQPTKYKIFQKPIIEYRASIIILLVIFTITLFTRFAMVRNLAAPPWVDSIHHGLITRLIMESGGIPETYAPYLPTEADYYHFGFHSALSFFIWLTGYDIDEAMLIFGQVLNSLIIFAIYLLAKTLTKNRNAALIAALISGVFTLMPAYYTSWGRYTQLVGLLVLPTAFRLIEMITKQDRNTNKNFISLLAISSIVFAGLILIHYRVTAFLGILIFAFIVSQINPKRWKHTIIQLIILGIIIILLLLPWLPGTITNLLLPKGIEWSGTTKNFSHIPWNFLEPGLGLLALALAGFGMVFGIILRKRFLITILLWTGLLYLLANLSWFGIPGSGLVNPVSMEITLFVPIAVIGGYAIGGVLEVTDKYATYSWKIVIRVVFIISGSITAILGVQRLLPTLNPTTFLAREADIPAIDWISKNVPEKETILINPTGWGYGLYMGQDGGYWISPLSEHLTFPPPVLYGLGTRTEINSINNKIEHLLNIGEDAAAIWEWLQMEDIRYVYLGARGGVISPKALETSGKFAIRYHQDGTWVFETLFDEAH